MKRVFKELIPYVVIIIAVILVRTFIVTPVRVDGDSMYPTLKNGELLILKKFDNIYKRFDIVVVDVNNDKLVKRIIGLPGEHVSVKDNVLYINDKEIEQDFLSDSVNTDDFDTILLGHTIIPDDSYLVMGDNRSISLDSRVFGFVKSKQIEGTVSFRIFPFNKIGNFN